MEHDVVQLDEHADALVLRLARPPVNAIDLGVVQALAATIERIAAFPPTRPLVVTGAGTCFSAGLDLKVVPQYGRHAQRAMLSLVNRLVADLYGMARPIVAALNGHALAAGLVLALACDYRVSTSARCKFGLPEINAGVPYPAAPMLVVREELRPSTARVLVLTGRALTPAEALAMGVVDEVVAPERVVPRGIEMAATLAAFSAYGRIKAQFRANGVAALARIVAENADPMLDRWI